MAANTQISAPGTRGAKRLQPTMKASTSRLQPSVSQCASARRENTDTTCAKALSPCFSRPNNPDSSLAATWKPTPVMNPTRALRDRKSARKPSRKTRARTSMTATVKATVLVRPT